MEMKKTGKIGVVFLLVFCICMMAGCGKDEKVSPEELAKLYGTWEKKSDDMTTTYIFNSDGTFAETSSVSGDFPITVSIEGTYTYDGKILAMTEKDASPDSAYVVEVTMENGQMLWDYNGYVMKYVKK